MRKVLEDHSPNQVDTTSDASVLGQEDEDDRSEKGKSVDETAAPERPPVARWMRDD